MIRVTDLVYRVAGRLLFEGASVAIPEGARVGLVGRNGAGKTTLFKLILGELAPESGEVTVRRGARVGQVAQEAPASEHAILDIVLAADQERSALLAAAASEKDGARLADIHARLVDIDAHAAPARAARILRGLGFDEAAQARPAHSFSGGWRMRVALAGMLFAAPDLLLLDEPTNYLDLEGTLWLERHLATYPHTLLIVSHDRDLLNGAVDQILELSQAKLTLWRGGFDAFVRQREAKRTLDQKAAEKLADKRAKLQAFVDRFRAKATKARQAQSRVKMLEKLGTLEPLVDEHAVPIRFPNPDKPLASPLLAFDGVAAGYGERTVLSGISLRLDADDRIGLLGSNGNGKSTFAKLVAQRLAPLGGTLHRASALKVGYFAQHQSDELDPEATVVAHVRRLLPKAGEAQVRGVAARFGFSAERASTPVAALSGGEKARLLLGLATFDGPHVLVLDEPTNHLDIDARTSLIEAITTFAGAVILISHDRSLLEACADRLWLVRDGRVVPFDGTLEEYRKLVLADGKGGADLSGASRAKVGNGAGSRADKGNGAGFRADKGNGAGEASGGSHGKTGKSEAGPAPGPAAHHRRRVEDAERALAEIERRLAGIDALLADPTLFQRDPVKGQALAELRAEAERAKARAEEAWLEAQARLEGATASP